MGHDCGESALLTRNCRGLKLIGAIVNWPTPNWKTFMGSMGLFEGIFGPFF